MSDNWLKYSDCKV